MSKSILQIIQSCSVQKTAQKRLDIRGMRPFWKSAIMQRPQPMQNPTFGSKIKIPKNMSKSILQIIQKFSVQKTAPKTTKYSRNEIILKISHHAKAIAHAKSLQWVKIKIPKNMSKSILQIIYSCSVQKTALKNTKYSRNETILKIGHHAKSSLWVQN